MHIQWIHWRNVDNSNWNYALFISDLQLEKKKSLGMLQELEKKQQDLNKKRIGYLTIIIVYIY